MLRFYYLLTQKVFECFSLAGLIFLFFSVKPVLAEVKINEFVPDSSSQEWIEFYNSSPSAEYLKDYYIDDDENFLDDSGSSAKKALTNLDTSNPNFPVISLSSSILNNSGDWVVLFDKDGNKVDSYQYTADPGRDISIGRYPDYSGNFFILSYSTKGDANAPPVTPTPSPTPSPTPTPTQSSEKPKATLKINSARDQNDIVVAGATQIYIDGNYTGNYAPETYTFCDDCKCGSNNVPCGFGSHTIKVEKTGYKSWTKTIDISAGNNYEETPILILETPSPTPTPKPSATPKASPTPSLGAENTIQASESALTLNSSSEPRVLGLESAKIKEDKEASGSDSYFNLAAVFFIIAGLSFLSAASYAYFKSKKKKEEKQNENKDSEDQEDF